MVIDATTFDGFYIIHKTVIWMWCYLFPALLNLIVFGQLTYEEYMLDVYYTKMFVEKKKAYEILYGAWLLKKEGLAPQFVSSNSPNLVVGVLVTRFFWTFVPVVNIIALFMNAFQVMDWLFAVYSAIIRVMNIPIVRMPEK